MCCLRYWAINSENLSNILIDCPKFVRRTFQSCVLHFTLYKLFVENFFVCREQKWNDKIYRLQICNYHFDYDIINRWCESSAGDEAFFSWWKMARDEKRRLMTRAKCKSTLPFGTFWFHFSCFFFVHLNAFVFGLAADFIAYFSVSCFHHFPIGPSFWTEYIEIKMVYLPRMVVVHFDTMELFWM